jgi:hypothetical protein
VVLLVLLVLLALLVPCGRALADENPGALVCRFWQATPSGLVACEPARPEHKVGQEPSAPESIHSIRTPGSSELGASSSWLRFLRAARADMGDCTGPLFNGWLSQGSVIIFYDLIYFFSLLCKLVLHPLSATGSGFNTSTLNQQPPPVQCGGGGAVSAE